MLGYHLHQVRTRRPSERRVDEARGALGVIAGGLLREARRGRVVGRRIVHHGAARRGGVPVGGLEGQLHCKVFNI